VASGFPAFLFLDEAQVDELWVQFKRDGVPQERVERATKKLSTQVKLGLGHLLKALGVDLSAGGARAEEREITTRKDFSAPFKLLLISEIIEDVQHVKISEPLEKELNSGEIIEILCPKIYVFPLPTLAGYVRQLSYDSIHNDDVDDNSEPPAGTQVEIVLKRMELIKQITDLNRALNFKLMEDFNEILSSFSSDYKELLFSILAVSNDDRMLVLAQGEYGRGKLWAAAVLSEDNADRSAIALASGNAGRIFGRVLACDRDENAELIRLLPIAIRTA
jgi:hypothetical protein